MKTQNQRVNFARAVIISGRPTTRKFDGCFEEGDGKEVYDRLKEKALAFCEESYLKAREAYFNGDSSQKKTFIKLDNQRKLKENFNNYLSPRLEESAN